MPRQFKDPEYVFLQLIPGSGGADRLAPAAGGSVQFYDIGTTTPKTTWADFDQAIANPNPVGLDSAGRLDNAVWLDGEYTVALLDADGTPIKTWEDRPEQGSALTIPTPLPSGEVLSNDAANLLWRAILELPDPTGATNNVLMSDGANGVWTSLSSLVNLLQPFLPEPEPPEWEIGDSYFKLGDYFVQWGTGSAAATGTDRTTTTVSYPVAFDAAPHFVGITVTSNNITGHSLVAIAVTSPSSGGCTVTFDNADRHYQGSSKIVNPVPFQWMAWGKRTDPV